jgi:hypothetical protein
MYGEQLKQLEDTFGVPIILIASRWREERAVDLGREAARTFLDIFNGLPGEYDRPPEKIGLFLVGRGGRPAFVNTVCRTLEGFGVDYRCFVPGVVNGGYTLLALGADEVVCHPYGGLGAYDAPPARRLSGRIDLSTLRAVRPHLDGEDERLPDELPRLAETAHLRSLAGRQLERVVDGTESGTGARVARELTVDRLGEEVALGASNLAGLGLEARKADEAERDVMWRLYREVESYLDLRGEVPERYTESELAEEVEFEPARSIPGAIIESAHSSAVYQLDTGSPDPDTEMLDGTWTQVGEQGPDEPGGISEEMSLEE